MSDIAIGKDIVFNYTGGIQDILLPPGKYQLHVYGAEGGKSAHGIRGGYGGHSKGVLTLKRQTRLYVVVGQKGQAVNGGYNGGGNGGAANSDSAGGGGATHISTRSGVLSSLSSYRSAVVIVAGGGGASGCSGTTGGGGGGLTGETALGTSYGGAATGGTQTTGGTGGQNGDGSRNNGSFGQGAHSKLTYSWPGGGGGGGWYGGGAGGNQSGGGGTAGGGSGYIGHADLSEASTETGVRIGNGYAIITPLYIGGTITTINCVADAYFMLGGENIQITAPVIADVDGHKSSFSRFTIRTSDNIKDKIVEKPDSNVFTFVAPHFSTNEDCFVIIEAIYERIRANSNYYRDSYLNELVGIDKLIE